MKKYLPVLVAALLFGCRHTLAQCPPLEPIVGPENPQMCWQQLSTYSIPNSDAANLVWTLNPPPPAIGSFVGPSAGQSVNIVWVDPGAVQLCATPTNPCYDNTPVCMSINVIPPPVFYGFQNITVCSGEYVHVDFYGPGDPVAEYYWVCYQPIGGIPSSGFGDIEFTAPVVFTPTSIGFAALVVVDGCSSTYKSFSITVLPTPSANAPPPVTACAGAPVSVALSGSPGATFAWENPNPAIGLPTNGTGNISFTAASVAQQEFANITVTPLYTLGATSCPGPPVTLTVTVNPAPPTDDPPDVSVCAGEPVAVSFSSPVPGAAFNWTNNNPAVGLLPAGTGNISFTAANVAATQTATVTVTATALGCPGPPQTLAITVRPRPNAAQLPNIVACAGAPVAVNFSGSPGATFNWTNNNPAVGLPPAGTGNIAANAANVTQTETATVTYVPELDGCAGQPRAFLVTVNPLPLMQAPGDVTACGGEQVLVGFDAPPGTNFQWANDNPFIGLPPAGTGSLIVFTAAQSPVQQTANITVTPVALGCPGQPQTFSVTVAATPTLNPPPNVTVCGGAPIAVTFSGSPGAAFHWTNNNPAVGLPPAGTGNIAATAATVTATLSATLSVTPVSPQGCPGQPHTLVVTVEKCCATSAGTLDTAALNACGTATLAVALPGNHALEPGDTLRLILYTNPQDPMGSIVQYSDSLLFPFLPGVMHPDSAYFVAVIAGPLLPNDSINAAAPCFSLAKGPVARWRPRPAIAVGSPPEAVCRDGCADVLFALTGTPPFGFEWLVEQGGQTLLWRQETTDAHELTVTVCPSDFALPGEHGYLNFRVRNLVDRFCGCE
ncbi:MAG: hypothetical protein KF734_11820 [Saprospiraceae bacterium]|nr:hypothetical protein [Saprospiraceae bacterium]